MKKAIRIGVRWRQYLKRLHFQKELNQFFAQEKVLAVVDHSRGSAGGGTVFVQSGGSFKPAETAAIPAVSMAVEHWDRIARLLKDKKNVQLELNIANRFYDGTTQYNTVAEIPGSDKKDEIVMLGRILIPGTRGQALLTTAPAQC